MAYRITQVTPPTGNIITVDDVKSWLSEASDHSDDVIEEIIMTVHDILDGQHSRLDSTILPTTWQLALWQFPSDRQPIRLRKAPIITLDSFEYDNDQGTVSNVQNTVLIFDYGHEYVASWDAWPTDVKQKPSVEPIRIQYRAGYEDATPAPIKQAALAICSHMFDNRSQYQGRSTAENLLDPVINNILSTYDLR